MIIVQIGPLIKKIKITSIINSSMSNKTTFSSRNKNKPKFVGVWYKLVKIQYKINYPLMLKTQWISLVSLILLTLTSIMIKLFNLIRAVKYYITPKKYPIISNIKIISYKILSIYLPLHIIYNHKSNNYNINKLNYILKYHKH
jgi:hypothetical protein